MMHFGRAGRFTRGFLPQNCRLGRNTLNISISQCPQRSDNVNNEHQFHYKYRSIVRALATIDWIMGIFISGFAFVAMCRILFVGRPFPDFHLDPQEERAPRLGKSLIIISDLGTYPLPLPANTSRSAIGSVMFHDNLLLNRYMAPVCFILSLLHVFFISNLYKACNKNINPFKADKLCKLWAAGNLGFLGVALMLLWFHGNMSVQMFFAICGFARIFQYIPVRKFQIELEENMQFIRKYGRNPAMPTQTME